MTNLVIDIGNSSAKAGLFRDRELLRTAMFMGPDPGEVESFLSGTAVDHTIMSSVRGPQPRLESYLEGTAGFIRFHSGLRTPVTNRYKTPETLGPDRLASVIGAAALYPGKDTLVIDAGTCITYDVVDREHNYYGGSISPGLHMRLRAMHEFTGKLPRLEPDAAFNGTYGEDTRTAILSGVQQGMLFELTGYIGMFRQKYPDLQVLLCGGDAAFFEPKLKISIFAPIVKTEANLVLTGLNEVIFQYND